MIDPPDVAVWGCYATVASLRLLATGFDPPYRHDHQTIKVYRAECECGWESLFTRLSYAVAHVDCEVHIYGE